jgi:hypothetical protein
VSADVAIARSEWKDGYVRLLDEARDPARAEALHAEVDAVTAELRKRVGATFTLRELAAAYPDSERWTREAVSDLASSPGWPRTLSLVGAAAFHLYARGAVDYTP